MTHRTDQIEQLLDQWEDLVERGEKPSPEDLCADDPELLEDFRRELKRLNWVDRLLDTEIAPSDGSPKPFPEVPSQLGRYRLDELVGEGGYSQVWKAHDPSLKRTVAVKVLAPDRLPGSDTLGEAERVANLRHPNIVAIYDVGQDQGLPYMVTDLVDGRDLAQWSFHRRPSQQQILRIIVKVAGALHYAHEQGVIHRDIKPQNILVDENGEPFVTDFGIAVTEADLESDSVLSAGTPAYMAPEQLDPRSPTLDRRCDIYSLGLVLYELLSEDRGEGRETPPGKAERFKPLRKSNPEVSRRLDTICMKALERDRELRWSNAEEFQRALLEELNQSQNLWKNRFGQVLGRAAAAVVLVLACCFVAVAVWYSGRDTPNGQTEADDAGKQSEGITGQTEPGREATLVREFTSLQGNVRCTRFSPDGQYLIAAGTLAPVRVWHNASGNEVCRLDHDGRYAFFDGPDQIVTLGRENEVRRWSFPDGKLLSTAEFSGCLTFGDHSSRANLAVYVTKRTSASVFDLAQGEDVWHLPGRSSPVYCLAITDDGTLAVTGERSGTARLWSVRDRKELRELIKFNNYVQACAVSPGNDLAVLGSWSQTTVLYDLEKGETVRTHKRTVYPMSAAFSPDGMRYAVGCRGKIYIWDTATGEEVVTIPSHDRKYIESLCFSPDGKKLVSGGRDSVVRLWRLPNG